MSFWKRLKFWDTEAIFETTIEDTQETFRDEKRKHPDRDPHAWLALTYGSRGGYSADPLISFTRTTMYSVLGDDAPTGLACYFLSQEMPAELPKFRAEMERVTAPAMNLIRQHQFLAQWEALNPWTAANVPGIREVVAESVAALARETGNS